LASPLSCLLHLLDKFFAGSFTGLKPIGVKLRIFGMAAYFLFLLRVKIGDRCLFFSNNGAISTFF
jgi:hypothetical protein